MVIVETIKQFEDFIEKYRQSDCILVPILSDRKSHPKINKLSLLYIQLINGDEYILPFNHIDATCLSLDLLYDLNFDNKKFTYNKKLLNHIIKLNNVIDVNLLYYMSENVIADIESTTSAHTFFETKFYMYPDINTIIPLMKHAEYCKAIATQICIHMSTYDINDKVFEIYNNDIINLLTAIESNGLKTKDGYLYSEYNIYTSTGRPSNRYGGINFSALNKDDGTRKQFISRFKRGKLIEFDYDSFHIRLIADLVGYSFPPDSVHKYMMTQYGINNYEESKTKSFRYLYGGIPKEIAEQIPYFKLVKDYIDKLYNSYNCIGKIKTPIYSRVFYKKNFNKMNRNKLMNYLIQNMETEYNMNMLANILPMLEHMHSKLILYTYDSFLFDLHPAEHDLILKIKQVLEHKNIPIKIKLGNNYHEMSDF